MSCVCLYQRSTWGVKCVCILLYYYYHRLHLGWVHVPWVATMSPCHPGVRTAAQRCWPQSRADVLSATSRHSVWFSVLFSTFWYVYRPLTRPNDWVIVCLLSCRFMPTILCFTMEGCHSTTPTVCVWRMCKVRTPISYSTLQNTTLCTSVFWQCFTILCAIY